MADNWDKLKQFKGQHDSGKAKPAAPTNSRNYRQTNQPGLPPGYLAGGYFYDNGNLKDELLVDHAREVARVIGGYNGIKSNQLRKFYGHVRAADMRMNYDAPFETVRPSIMELSAFVAEAAGKQKVPAVFRQFIDKNLENIRDAKSFRHGFVKHFQAVVGFFSSFYRD